MNLYHVTKFSPCFSFTVYCFYTKINSFMTVLSTRIVLDCFYLLIFYSEKFSTDVCRLPYAVNVNLNLSIVFNFSWDGCNSQEKWNTKVVSNFGEQIRYIMGDVQVAYKNPRWRKFPIMTSPGHVNSVSYIYFKRMPCPLFEFQFV